MYSVMNTAGSNVSAILASVKWHRHVGTTHRCQSIFRKQEFTNFSEMYKNDVTFSVIYPFDYFRVP